MPNIRLRADNRYEARVRHNNKYYSVYAKTKADISKKCKELQKRLLAQKNEIINDNSTIEQYFENWYKTYKEPFISESTKESILNTFKVHILPNFKNEKLSNLTTQKIQLFLNKYQKSRIKEIVYTYFNAMLKQAVKTRILNYNPFDATIKEKK